METPIAPDQPGQNPDEGFNGLQILVHQMRQAVQAHCWFPALICALTVPDICAALDSNGKTDGYKYRNWIGANMDPMYKESASPLWDLRCSLLHQGRLGKGKLRAAFTAPIGNRTAIFHNFAVGTVDGNPDGSDDFLMFDIEMFVEHVEAAVIDWTERSKESQRVKANLRRAARLSFNDPAIRLLNDTWIIR